MLVSLFRTLGDVRALLSAMALATSALVVGAVFLAFSALLSARAREHAVLRAIGASPGYILAALWMELGTILAAAVVLGTLLGWVAARIAATVLGRAAGLSMTVSLGWDEVMLAGAILAAGLVAAAAPALLGLRAAPGALLKG